MENANVSKCQFFGDVKRHMPRKSLANANFIVPFLIGAGADDGRRIMGDILGEDSAEK